MKQGADDGGIDHTQSVKYMIYKGNQYNLRDDQKSWRKDQQYHNWVNEQNSKNYDTLKKFEYPQNCGAHGREHDRPRWKNNAKHDVKRKEEFQDRKLLSNKKGLKPSDGCEDWKRFNQDNYCRCRHSSRKKVSNQTKSKYCKICGLEHLNTVAAYK